MMNLARFDLHRQRWITGTLLTVPLLALLIIGPFWGWVILVQMAAVVGMWELQRLLFVEGLSPGWQAFNFMVGLTLPPAAAVAGPEGLHGALVAAVLGAFCGLLIREPENPDGLARVARLALGWLYLPYLLSYLVLLCELERGRVLALYPFLVIAAGDIGAYYCGRRWGRHKLYEKVSPKKTVEGSLGGLASSLVLGTAWGLLWFPLGSLPVLVAMSLVLAVVGQVGDLIESMIKRMSGRKDASELLPGHGGLLDRLDSLVFGLPCAWFFGRWWIG